MNRSADVLVVGGGAIGVCVALEAARAGASVTLLEQGAAVAAGCSAGNAGLVTPSHATPLASPTALWQGIRWLGVPDSPFALRLRPYLVPWLARFVAAALSPERVRASARVIRELATSSLALHAEIAASGLDTGFEQRGVLNVYASERGFADGRAEAEEAQAHGMPAEVLDAAAARERVPTLAGPIAGAIYYPRDAHCDPLRFVRAVAEAATGAGARVQPGVEVLALRRRGARVESVETTAGELRAGEIVLAAGAWTPALARGIGASVPVASGKGYHVDIASGTGDPSLPVWFQESRVIATPLAGRLRLAGTLELVGLDLSVDRRRVAAVERAGRRGLHGLEGRQTLEIWRGLRPCSPDGLPIVGRPGGLENVTVATGHGMMGLTLAPVTGRLVAELLRGAQPSHDLAPLSPDRFRGAARS